MALVQVKDAEGPVLDWMVAKCEFDTPTVEGGVVHAAQDYMPFQPSVNWSQGGPIMDRELIDTQAEFKCGNDINTEGYWYWQACVDRKSDVTYWFDGPTRLIAAMRCYVAYKLGDTVEVPDELI